MDMEPSTEGTIELYRILISFFRVRARGIQLPSLWKLIGNLTVFVGTGSEVDLILFERLDLVRGHSSRRGRVIRVLI
jgi:hypothetical protein